MKNITQCQRITGNLVVHLHDGQKDTHPKIEEDKITDTHNIM